MYTHTHAYTCTYMRFLLTHVDSASDNAGWEKRIEKHKERAPYDYDRA